MLMIIDVSVCIFAKARDEDFTKRKNMMDQL